MTAAVVGQDGPLAETLLSSRWRGDRLPAALRRRAAPLLNQQFWCWGQDIRGDEGNLLLRFGFSRHRPPRHKRGSSAYTLYLDSDRTVVLWGFGLFYGARGTGGLFLPRYGCEPHLLPSATPPSTVWEPQQLALRCGPASVGEWRVAFGLLAAVCDWIGAYETWILDAVGVAYRQRCVAAWDKVRVPPDQMAEWWAAVARQCVEWEQEVQRR